MNTKYENALEKLMKSKKVYDRDCENYTNICYEIWSERNEM